MLGIRAITQGIDLPFSCRAGIWGACVGRVVAGAVDMSDIEDISYTLEDDQVNKTRLFGVVCWRVLPER